MLSIKLIPTHGGDIEREREKEREREDHVALWTFAGHGRLGSGSVELSGKKKKERKN